MSHDDCQSSTRRGPALSRRQLLLGLVALAPAVSFGGLHSAWAASEEDEFLKISRVIIGTAALSADVSQRMKRLLAKRDDQFAQRLHELAAAMQKTGGTRDAILSALSDPQVTFALEIAKPWYLGYVGKPSDFVLKDDAEFATFLEAQSYQKIIDEVPRPTYPDGSAGWWAVAPAGVVQPTMPEQIADWTFHPGGPAEILSPDPKWKAYATAKHATIEDARQNKPTATPSKK